jgi:hypothetical protein
METFRTSVIIRQHSCMGNVVLERRTVENINSDPIEVEAYNIDSHFMYVLHFNSEQQNFDGWPMWTFQLVQKQHECHYAEGLDRPVLILRTQTMYVRNAGGEAALVGPLNQVEITVQKENVACSNCNTVFLKVCGLFSDYDEIIRTIPLYVRGYAPF